MKPQQKNYPQQDKLINIYEKHIGLNSEMEYKTTPKEDILAAMKEYGKYCIDEVTLKKESQELIKSLKEYFFNTANPGDNISQLYLLQTVKFINDIINKQ